MWYIHGLIAAYTMKHKHGMNHVVDMWRVHVDATWLSRVVTLFHMPPWYHMVATRSKPHVNLMVITMWHPQGRTT